MPYNNITGDITEEQRTAVLTAIETIETNIDFLINLTPAERETIPKMGENTVSFVMKATDMAEINPEFVPPYVDAVEFRSDYERALTLKQLGIQIISLGEKFIDTSMASGSESYVTALTFYNSLKAAARMNVPGANELAVELESVSPPVPTH